MPPRFQRSLSVTEYKTLIVLRNREHLESFQSSIEAQLNHFARGNWQVLSSHPGLNSKGELCHFVFILGRG